MLERLTQWTVRHRSAVFMTWGIVILLGALALGRINDHLTAVTDVPGSASATANKTLSAAFGSNADGSFVVLYTFTQADESEIVDMKRRIEQAAQQVPTAMVQQQRAVGGVLYASIGTALPLIEASAQTPRLRAALAQVGLANAMVTGPPALEHDVRPVLAEDLQRGGLLGLALAIVVLLVAFGRSRRVFVPLIVATATVAGSLGIVYLLSTVVTMVLYVPSIVELVGLGLAIDYSILLVQRHQLLRDSADPLMDTARTAGRTVLWAGMTAAIGLAALLLVPIPLVRSLGLAGCIVPVIAVLAALTLTPPLLSVLGNGPVRGMLVSTSTQWWLRVGQLVTARPRSAMLATLLLCAVAAAPLSVVQVAPASLTALPREAPAAQAVAYLSKRLGPGVVTPHELVVQVADGTALDGPNDKARQRLAEQLTKLPEVFGVFTDTGSNYVDNTRSFQRIFVIGRHELADPRTSDLVAKLRALDPLNFGYAPGARLLLGGAPAQGEDFLATLRSSMPWVVLLILIAAGLALSKAFGSWRIATASIMLNLVSLGAACGIVVAVFQLGLGAGVLGTYRVPQIESWTFVFMFALLFGLTTDYQVFVVRSILEARDNGDDAADAIRSGIASTGGIITVAALAFVFALSGLVFGRIAGLQELGLGLAAGVLVDATIIRGVLLPSTLRLLHRF